MSQGIEGISFVVPCFNSGEYLSEAVNSLMAQPLTCPYEVLVVDDGSDEPKTLQALAACSELPEVRIIRCGKRQGHHAARNIGVGASKFRYVMQLDSDDRLSTAPELMRRGSYPSQAVEMLEADADVAFVHTLSCMFGDFDGLTISSYPCREELILAKHHVPTSVVCRREDALCGGLYDPRVQKWGDWAFAVNLLGGRFRRGAKNVVRCVPAPFHEYRVHTSGQRVSEAKVSEYEMTLLVVENNLDLFRHHLSTAEDATSIAHEVLARKPSRLEDLMHMASFDLSQALTVARQRQFSLPSPFEHLGIP